MSRTSMFGWGSMEGSRRTRGLIGRRATVSSGLALLLASVAVLAGASPAAAADFEVGIDIAQNSANVLDSYRPNQATNA